MTINQIARICHEANRAYCIAIGDDTQVPWDDAPDWQKLSALDGVEHAIHNPGAMPSDSHKSWLAVKAVDGWVYGPVKDADKKTHPCIVPFDGLPVEQQKKDHLFLAVVRACE